MSLGKEAVAFCGSPGNFIVWQNRKHGIGAFITQSRFVQFSPWAIWELGTRVWRLMVCGRAGDRHETSRSTEVEDSKDIPFRGCQKSSSKACSWLKVLLSPSQIFWLDSQLVLTAVAQTS